MRTKIWLGIKVGGQREIFKSVITPTEISVGHLYAAVIGPFRTMRGACFMRDYGQGNPHCRTVEEAEQLGKKYETINPKCQITLKMPVEAAEFLKKKWKENPQEVKEYFGRGGFDIEKIFFSSETPVTK